MEKALFGAGCFWGVEESFRKLPGVINTEVGYSGGNIDSPSYEVVCSGNTNHAEVVLVEFDDTKISFENLVNHFWTVMILQLLIDKAQILALNIDQ